MKPPKIEGATLSACSAPEAKASPFIANGMSSCREKGDPNNSFNATTAAAEEEALDPSPLPAATFFVILNEYPFDGFFTKEFNKA